MISRALRCLLELKGQFSSKSKAAKRKRRLSLESLESRHLLSLLGVTPSFPLTFFDSTGHIQYDASTHALDVSATPLAFLLNASSIPTPITGTAAVGIHAKVDNSGKLIGGNGNPDFQMTGTVEINGVNDSGTLLTGKILQFGSQYNSGTRTSEFDYRFQLTGGLLQSFYAGMDIGVTMDSENSSSFTGSFDTDFSGGAKGEVGPIAPLQIVVAMGKSPATPQSVEVVDPNSGAVSAQFAPYGNSSLGGISVATGVLNGSGYDDIVTGPGRGSVPKIEVYDQTGKLLTQFQAYPSSVNGGVQVAVGDVFGNGLEDIITVPSYGPAEVRVFKNLGIVGGTPIFSATPTLDFLAFPSSFIGGAVVAAADMGSTPNKSFVNTPDGKAEIIVGSGAGMKATVEVFDVSHMTVPTPTVQPTPVASFTPFSTPSKPFQGGVSLSVAKLAANAIPAIVVGAGANGRSLVDVWGWNTATTTLSSLSGSGGFAAFTGPSSNAAIQVTTQNNSSGIATAILAAQGPGGTASQVVQLEILGVSPLSFSSPTAIAGSYPGPYTVAAIDSVLSSLSTATPLATTSLTGSVSAAAALATTTNKKSTVPTQLPNLFFALLSW